MKHTKTFTDFLLEKPTYPELVEVIKRLDKEAQNYLAFFEECTKTGVGVEVNASVINLFTGEVYARGESLLVKHDSKFAEDAEWMLQDTDEGERRDSKNYAFVWHIYLD